MHLSWQEQLAGRLDAELSAGGCRYIADGEPAPEPTALACLAMAHHRPDSQAIATGLAFLARRQRADGGVPSMDGGPAWPTALAVLAWKIAGAAGAHDARVAQGLDALLAQRGEAVAPGRLGPTHDTTLVGWSWVDRTHSWVEPTSYAILAMRATGNAAHPRTRDGVRLLRDRAIRGGGWNYGNRDVLASTLRPFPETTGVALLALAGEPREPLIDESVAWLRGALERVRSPMSLGWGVMALRAWDAAGNEWDAALARCAERVIERSTSAVDAALLLLADAPRCRLIPGGAA